MRHAIRSLLLLAAVAHAAPARAADDATDVTAAREHFRTGQERYAAGDYEGALREMEAARMIRAVPDFDYNIALCNEKLGRLQDAINAFKVFIAESIDMKAITDAQERIKGLQARIDAQKAAETANAARAAATSPARPAAPTPASTTQVTQPQPPAQPAGVTPSYTVPVAVGMGAIALAAVGVALVAPVTQEDKYAYAEFQRQGMSPTQELQSQIDYMQIRLMAGYTLFAAAGVAAIADAVLWARAARGRRDAAPKSALPGLLPSSPGAPATLGFQF